QVARGSGEPAAEVAVTLQQQPEALRQQRTQRDLAARRRVDRIADRTATLSNFVDSRRKIANEAGREGCAFFRAQWRGKPGFRLPCGGGLAEDADSDVPHRGSPLSFQRLVLVHKTRWRN